jgi:hypothetical protein
MECSFRSGRRRALRRKWPQCPLIVFDGENSGKDVYYIHSRMYVKQIFVTGLIIVKNSRMNSRDTQTAVGCFSANNYIRAA